MPFVTSDQIRDTSIKVVEGFLNEKVPLSEGLAKQASLLQLNSEQIHRAIEATNSIAYLKVLSLSDDRTAEFPLCKYAEVIEKIATPVATTITKTASTLDSKETFAPEMEKVASQETKLELSTTEKYVHFIKMASINERELDELKIKAEALNTQIIKQAQWIAKDSRSLEKIATVAEGTEFTSLTKIVFGEEKEYADTGLFKTAELIEAKRLQDLVKQASDLNAEIEQKQALHERSELIKQAFLGALLSGTGKAIGGAISSVVKAPITLAGNAIKRTASNVGRDMGNAAKESVINPVRGAFGKAPLPKNMSPTKRFGLGAGAVAAAGIATDAALYRPGTDATTGRSKDVWTTLQREPT